MNARNSSYIYIYDIYIYAKWIDMRMAHVDWHTYVHTRTHIPCFICLHTCMHTYTGELDQILAPSRYCINRNPFTKVRTTEK